jgi:ABC-type lipoprotein release transport system permease subunit
MRLLNVRIGWFLALRALRRANIWTTSLIIFVMILTFLNLVVVSGILVGLIQGSIEQWHKQFTSDVMISALIDKDYIENSQNIIALVEHMPEVAHLSPRFAQGGTIEANYKTRRETDKADSAGTQFIGIDPSSEDSVTGLASHLMSGSYLSAGDYDQVLVGYFMLKQYVPIESPDFQAISNVAVGTKIRVQLGNVTREVTVKGILGSKVDNIRRAVFMPASELRSLIGRSDGNVAQIAILLKNGIDPTAFKQELILRGVDKLARVQTYVDAQPQFLKDIVATFNALGSALSSIGLVVSSITIFIVIFINAITRRKYIGILKGIGIEGGAIRWSYVFQSVFYAAIGSIVGLVVVYALLVPFFAAHPINFPFSDGILVAPVGQTMFKVGLLVFSTIIAGFIPAWMIIRKNTLDSILGRN